MYWLWNLLQPVQNYDNHVLIQNFYVLIQNTLLKIPVTNDDQIFQSDLNYVVLRFPHFRSKHWIFPHEIRFHGVLNVRKWGSVLYGARLEPRGLYLDQWWNTPCVDFCGPCFSLFAPCDFYPDHVFHFNPPAVFIQTAFFQTVTSRVLLW